MLHLLFKPSFTTTDPFCYAHRASTLHHYLFMFPSNRILPGSFHMPLAFSPHSRPTGLCIMDCCRNSLQRIHVYLIETFVNSLLKCVFSHFQPMVSFGGNVLFCHFPSRILCIPQKTLYRYCIYLCIWKLQHLQLFLGYRKNWVVTSGQMPSPAPAEFVLDHFLQYLGDVSLNGLADLWYFSSISSPFGTSCTWPCLCPGLQCLRSF